MLERPSKIVCVGRNYAAHAKELGNDVPAEPLIFLKPPSSLITSGASIRLPRVSKQVEYEGEFGVVIGERLRRADAEQARRAVAGIVAANDVTARDLQRGDGQWSRAKGFDTFCPLGPWIETSLDAGDVQVTTRLDGKTVQDSRTSLMMHGVAALVAHVSSAFTLLPGDVILTGTPAGVGPVQAGQHVEVEVEGIGVLSNVFVTR